MEKEKEEEGGVERRANVCLLLGFPGFTRLMSRRWQRPFAKADGNFISIIVVLDASERTNERGRASARGRYT